MVSSRCDDCLTDFVADGPLFVVLKRVRELPDGMDPVEARNLEGLCYDQVYVCGECAGWYGDDAIRLDDEG